MTKQEKLDYVAAGLRGFALLETKRTTEAGWIAFRLGCTEKAAQKLIDELRAQVTGGGR